MSSFRSLRAICRSNALREGGEGVRFVVRQGGNELPAFAVRYNGRVYAYVNRCAHLGTELDWIPGEFFDSTGLYLVCATHGALFEPDSGYCVGGPCKGQALELLSTEEIAGTLYLLE